VLTTDGITVSVLWMIQVESSSSSEGLVSKQRDTSAENDTSGELSVMKRKRNSYADSPHKLRCPYCPRAFPWISSLKRHILTHTGISFSLLLSLRGYIVISRVCLLVG